MILRLPTELKTLVQEKATMITDKTDLTIIYLNRYIMVNKIFAYRLIL